MKRILIIDDARQELPIENRQPADPMRVGPGIAEVNRRPAGSVSPAPEFRDQG